MKHQKLAGPGSALDLMKQLAVRIVIALLILAGLIVAGAGSWFYWRARSSLPQLDGMLKVEGLSAPVEVLRDARGVPHLRAESMDDLLFAQGYVTAQDRLWQMDLSRRLAFGELSELVGEPTLRLDIENRTLGFRQVAERTVGELDPGTRRLLEAYSRGVNTFLSAHINRLPIEFTVLRYRPSPWRDIDTFGAVLNMNKMLNTDWPTKLMRERIRARLQPELYADLFPDHSPLDHPVAEPLILPPGKTRGVSLSSPAEDNALDPVLTSLIESTEPALNGLGSNNWVLNGSHTQSGKPLLANDPHLGHGIPSIWYMIHLKAPGINVSGVSLPGVPGVIIGHNERIAWGMTNTGPDVQDLYIETFEGPDSRKYLHNGRWFESDIRDEVIKIRGKTEYHLKVISTRHGPVVSHDGGRDLALRWTALEKGYLNTSVLNIDRAQNWTEFTAALKSFSGPMQNFVYADVDGNIGYYAAGWVPIRKLGDGTVPVPGSSDEYDWTGYVPFEGLPHAYNPPVGIIATANGRVVPDGYPYFITSEWEPPYRTARIYNLLEAGNRFTVQDMLKIQCDIHPLDDEWLAKQVVQASFHHPPRDPEAQYALGLLRHWDGEARVDSGATLVAEVTRHAFLERILRPKLGADFMGYHWPMQTVFLQNVVSNRWERWLPREDISFSETLIRSLEEGVKRIPGMVGNKGHDAWRWGDTIPLTFRHPLSGGSWIFGRLFNVGPFPQAGTASTVKQTSSSLGPSMRMVVDFSNLDASVQNITLGESGQVFSPHYKDQFEAWYNGRSFPMLFTDAAVDRVAVHKLVLEPASN
jgi:penicillin amidase